MSEDIDKEIPEEAPEAPEIPTPEIPTPDDDKISDIIKKPRKKPRKKK